jgi:hypothetical protein
LIFGCGEVFAFSLSVEPISQEGVLMDGVGEGVMSMVDIFSSLLA